MTNLERITKLVEERGPSTRREMSRALDLTLSQVIGATTVLDHRRILHVVGTKREHGRGTESQVYDVRPVQMTRADVVSLALASRPEIQRVWA